MVVCQPNIVCLIVTGSTLVSNGIFVCTSSSPWISRVGGKTTWRSVSPLTFIRFCLVSYRTQKTNGATNCKKKANMESMETNGNNVCSSIGARVLIGVRATLEPTPTLWDDHTGGFKVGFGSQPPDPSLQRPVPSSTENTLPLPNGKARLVSASVRNKSSIFTKERGSILTSQGFSVVKYPKQIGILHNYSPFLHNIP